MASLFLSQQRDCRDNLISFFIAFVSAGRSYEHATLQFTLFTRKLPNEILFLPWLVVAPGNMISYLFTNFIVCLCIDGILPLRQNVLCIALVIIMLQSTGLNKVS